MAVRHRVGSRELKTRLGRYLAEVRRGARVIVTERGEPIAELRPLSDPADASTRLERLRVFGIVTREHDGRLKAFRPVRVSGRGLSQAVVDQRADRF